MTNADAQPEFSFDVDVRSLTPAGKKYHLKAGPNECAKIAKRLGVIAVHLCEGDIHIGATKTVITISGTVRGAMTRECVASLEEMEEAVADSFELEFFRDESAIDPEDDSVEWDLAEIHEGDVFDIGELLVQQLSLAMDPFPRKEGAPGLAAEYGAEDSGSPFAELHQILEKNN
ncbi:MAG: DUF177 domain-containing protein [Pseudomonadota bacterium]